jgi:hypothetical protein
LELIRKEKKDIERKIEVERKEDRDKEKGKR